MRQTPRQTATARRLRRRQTEAERILWRALRARQLNGLKFRRQVPFGPYILDFYCPTARLVIEADGGQHTLARDAHRDAYLIRKGLIVLHFWNSDIHANLGGVLTHIATTAGGRP